MLAPRRGNVPRRRPENETRPPTADRPWPSTYSRRGVPPTQGAEFERSRAGQPSQTTYHLHRHYHDRRGQWGAGTGFATGFGFALGWMAARLLVTIIMLALLIWLVYTLLSSVGLTSLFG